MKRILFLILILALLSGCASQPVQADIAATTLPVYEFTVRLCQGTPLTVTRLVTEEVSCLHDYSLNVKQVKAAEAAQCIVISGAGLETFMDDVLAKKAGIDASRGIQLIAAKEVHHHDDHESHHHEEHDGHHHESDPHFWLSPAHAKEMAVNICKGLSVHYPDYSSVFAENCTVLCGEIDELAEYGRSQLAGLSCRELITFHDGFAYFAESFQLSILDAIEEESGSEASARELIHLIEEVEYHQLPAVFIEKSGSSSAADIISRETGCSVFTLDMAMSGESYFDAMYHNIDSVKEALQ